MNLIYIFNIYNIQSYFHINLETKLFLFGFYFF